MRKAWLLLLGWGLCCGLLAARAGVPEIELPEAQRQKLEKFEAFQLQKADQSYANGKYDLAAKEYDGFMVEFAKSPAVAYAAVRKGRCAQLANNLHGAIKEYTEVADYFFDQPLYAAAALYFHGACYWERRDPKNAIKIWTELVADQDYRQYPWAATAFKRLADNLILLGRFAEAMPNYSQALLEPKFRATLEPAEVQGAIDQLLLHYFRRQPDEAKLREFYLRAGGFEGAPKQVPPDVAGDWEYWAQVRRRVWGYGQFNTEKGEDPVPYFKYWAEQLVPVGEKHFGTNDEFLLDVANIEYRSHGEAPKHFARLDAIFAKNDNEKIHNARVVAWVRFFAGAPEKIKAYVGQFRWEQADGRTARDLVQALADLGQNELAADVGKRVNLAHLDFAERTKLLELAWDRLRNPELGRHLFGVLGLERENDDVRVNTARWFWNRDASLALKCYALLQDQERANMERLDLYLQLNDWKQAVAAGQEAVKAERFRSQAWGKVGAAHERLGAWELAIAAHRQCQDRPANLYRIAACFKNWGKQRSAIRQLREIENDYKDEAAKAALVQVAYYREFQQEEAATKTLWRVLGTYGTSPEAGQARVHLETQNLRIPDKLDPHLWEGINDEVLKD